MEDALVEIFALFGWVLVAGTFIVFVTFVFFVVLLDVGLAEGFDFVPDVVFLDTLVEVDTVEGLDLFPLLGVLRLEFAEDLRLLFFWALNLTGSFLTGSSCSSSSSTSLGSSISNV